MTSVAQQSSSEEESTASRFWRQKLEEHPNIHGVLSTIRAGWGFVFNGHIIVWFVRWIIRVCGYIAESALLLAVLWISATSVAPELLELMLSKDIIQRLLWLALIALALIPEVVLPNAIINSINHWQRVAIRRENIIAWVWAILFTLPTILFLYLTAVTIGTLTNNGGNLIQAATTLLGMRCFAGWTYGLLEMVYAGVGKQTMQLGATISPVPVTVLPDEMVKQLRNELSTLYVPMIEELRTQTATLLQQNAQLRRDIETIATSISVDKEAIFPVIEEETELSTDAPLLADISVYLSRQQRNTDSFPILGNPVDSETSTKPATKSAKITRKLSPDRETKPSTKVAVKGRENARQKAMRIVNRNPDISPTELAQKAQITRQYASQILKQNVAN